MSKLEVDAIEPQSGTTLTIGASGDTITLTSGAKTSGFGKIGQVVVGSTETQETTTSTTFVNSNLTVNITPTSTSSKILIHCHVNVYTDVGNVAYVTIMKDGVNQGESTDGFGYAYAGGSAGDDIVSILGFNHLSSPATTSQITYALGFRVASGTGYYHNSNTRSEIIALEILP